MHVVRDQRHLQPLVHSRGRHLNHLHLPPEHTLLDPTCPSSRHGCAIYEPGIQTSSSVSRSKTTVTGATCTGGFLRIPGITSSALDGDYNNGSLLGTKGHYSVSASAQDWRHSEEWGCDGVESGAFAAGCLVSYCKRIAYIRTTVTTTISVKISDSITAVYKY